ncbi:cubilin homolog [Ornithodoros turicata]|uniref:cubilin homolog n=1 Tax=Ornithodoros turicata TaxID=34597 RepID=UPI0031388311
MREQSGRVPVYLHCRMDRHQLRTSKTGLRRVAWRLQRDTDVPAHSRHVLNITFTKFSLEEGHECAFDFLEIHDGETLSSPLVGRYCGTSMNGKNLTSTHPVITLWFKTDHSVSGEGFAFNWIAADPVCGKALDEADVGSVQSPGYPGNYPSRRDCFWTVRVPVGKRIQFHSATLQLEHHDNCNYDFLKIYDGASENDQLLGSYCSTGIPSPVVTAGHLALLHFHSDDSQTDTGFHVTYASVPGAVFVLRCYLSAVRDA